VVNTACLSLPSTYSNFLSCAWSHEAAHLQAAIAAAKKPQFDVPAVWESAVGIDVWDLMGALPVGYLIIQNGVRDESVDAHASMLANHFYLGDNLGSGWSVYPHAVDCPL